MTKEESNAVEIEHCGVTAPVSMWRACGYDVNHWIDGRITLTYRRFDTPIEKLDGDVRMALFASSHTDWRALAWLLRHRAKQGAARELANALRTHAEALSRVPWTVSVHVAAPDFGRLATALEEL